MPAKKPAGAAKTEDTGPRFCSSCGEALAETSHPVFAGFDTTTGARLPDRIVTRRRCAVGGHDRYVKTDEGWEPSF